MSKLDGKIIRWYTAVREPLNYSAALLIVVVGRIKSWYRDSKNSLGTTVYVVYERWTKD